MKPTLSNYLTIGGFIILGVVNHFQLKFKVVEIESSLKISKIEMELHVSKEITKLKEDLKTQFKKDGIAYRN